MTNNKPVTPLYLKTEPIVEAVESQSDPLSEAYSKHVDCMLQQEPLWHMNDAELTWSILSTELNYTVSVTEGPYKILNNSPLFGSMEPLEFNASSDCSSDDRFEEVTAEVKPSNCFDEVSAVSTTYLGGYLSPGEERTFPFENQVPIDSRGITLGHLMDRTVIKFSLTMEHQRAT